MLGKTHAAAGAALSLGILASGKLDPGMVGAGILVGATVTGALLPDIDIKGSTVSSKHKFISFFIRIFISHRGTHSLPFMALLSIPLILLTLALPPGLKSYGIIFAFGILSGYASHIILDMLTPKGVPILNPILPTKVSILGIKTGGLIEVLIRVGLIILSLYFIFEIAADIGFDKIFSPLWKDIISFYRR